MTFVGIDVGLSSTKAVVVGGNGHVLGSAGRAVARRTGPGGRCERDSQEQWAAVCEVTRAAVAAAEGAGPPAAVAVCGHGDGLILADERGQPVRPAVLSLDTRCQSLLDAMERDGRLLELEQETHRGAAPGRPVPLLLWLLAHEPGTLRAARRLLFAKDFVKLRLTGAVTTDYSDAGAGLLRRDRPEYATSVLERLGLGRCTGLLPPLVPSAERAGTVVPAAADETGLPAGIPVASGAHDVPSAVIGAGLAGPSEVCAVAGTWSIDATLTGPGAVSPDDADHGVHERWFVNGTSILALSSSPSGTDLLDDLAAAHGTGGVGPLLAKMLTGDAGPDRQPGDPLTVIPSLHGFGRAARSGTTILGYRPGRPDSDLARATIEATAFRHRLGIELLSRLTEPPVTEAVGVRAAGGLTRSDTWVQLLADVLGTPVRRGGLPAAGAIGAAAMAGVAAGAWPALREAVAMIVGDGQVFTPRPARDGELEDRYQRYRSAFAALTASRQDSRSVRYPAQPRRRKEQHD